MSTLKTKTLSLFALASLSAIPLGAVGVMDYEDYQYSNSSLRRSTLSLSGGATNYTLSEASASSYDIIKYVRQTDGSLTAYYYSIVGSEDDDDGYVDGVDFTQVTSGTDVYMDFIGGTSASSGLAVKNTGSINSITGDFIGNVHKPTNGANGILTNTGSIGSITGDFLYNYSYTASSYSANSGVIFNSGGTIGLISGDFVGNYGRTNSGTARGGAIWNYSGSVITAIEANFINNFTYSNSGGSSMGGAVLNSTNCTIGFLAQTKDIEFTGNFTVDGDVYSSNAISNVGTANFNAYNSHTITVNDGIDNVEYSGATTTRGTININGAVYAVGDTTTNIYANSGDASKVIFNNTVQGQNITVHAGTLELGSYAGGLEFSLSDTYTTVSYTTEASVASMVNSSVTVNSGAILQIASSGVSFDTDSSLTLSSGSKILLDASASLIFKDGASLTYTTGAIFVVDLSDFLSGDLSYTLFTFEEDATSAESLYTYLTDDAYFTITENADYDGDDFELYLDGENIVLSNIGAPVPEPSTYAMIIGILALGFAYYKRRK